MVVSFASFQDMGMFAFAMISLKEEEIKDSLIRQFR